MLGIGAIKLNKVFVVQGDDCPFVLTGKKQNLLIRNASVCIACFLNRQNIMAQFSKKFRDASRKLLVGIETSHLLNV